MQIQHCVDEKLLNMRLIDLRCKHAMNTSEKGYEVIRLSRLIGYGIAEWGACSNHVDIKYHADVIMKMEEDKYEHPMRIVICNYDFSKEPCIWVDNIHSAIRYIRKHNLMVTLKDIPFYVVDITGKEPVISESRVGLIERNEDRIKGMIKCAYDRQERSNSEELIRLNYKMVDLLLDNPILFTCKSYFGTDGATRGPKR